jgi:hypothetical protein
VRLGIICLTPLTQDRRAEFHRRIRLDFVPEKDQAFCVTGERTLLQCHQTKRRALKFLRVTLRGLADFIEGAKI